MKLWNGNTLKLGIRSLMMHKLRSLLTMLGVILGVGSVIAMLAIGEGSKREALDQLRQLGASNIIIRSVKPGQNESGESSSGSGQGSVSAVLEYGLKYKDLDRLQATLPTVDQAVPISLVRKNAMYQSRRESNARILGTTSDYLSVKNLAIRRGRFLSASDENMGATVAVLGDGAAEKLFSFEDPVGKVIQLGTNAFTIVGVLNTQGSGSATAGAIGQQNFNNDIYVPLGAIRKRFGDLQMILRSGSRQFERTELSGLN